MSLGGDSVTGDVFRSIVSRKDQLSNFTESLNSLYQDEVIQVKYTTNYKKTCSQRKWSGHLYRNYHCDKTLYLKVSYLQGLEMDWEWPMDTQDKKDKIKLIRYMRVSRAISVCKPLLTVKCLDKITRK